MPAYAMVVVVEAANPSAMDALRETLIPDADAVLFVGEPWEVHAVAPDVAEQEPPEFDSLTCFDQHPDR